MFLARRTPKWGFTLLELCIVLALAVLLMGVAMPSLSGQLSRRRLQGTFDRFDALVGEARKHAVSEGKPYVLVWRRGGVAVFPADLSDEDRRKAEPTAMAVFDGAANEECAIFRGASLTAQPAAQWTFWPTGNCEPVTIRYRGTAGNWEAAYSGLSGQGTLDTFIAR